MVGLLVVCGAMIYCLNPECPRPENPTAIERCWACGMGLRLKQRYQAIAPLGQGGFGRTFRAIDLGNADALCVIKQFFPVQGRYLKKAAELFEQEALRLEELGSHPQIPALLAHFSQDQQQYLVQEFIDGETLAGILSRGALPEPQVQEILLNLLPVLQYVHARDVIHRDIKPANIIATVQRSQPAPRTTDWNALLFALSQESVQGYRNGDGRFSQFLTRHLTELPDLAIADYQRCQQLSEQFDRYRQLTFSQRQYLVADASRLLYELRHKHEATPIATTGLPLVLVDFGAAKSLKGLTFAHTGTAIGSPEYQSPEQARGKAGFASDLYSLGVTCLHLLTGVSPLELFDPHEDVWIWRRFLKIPVSDRFGRILDKLIEPGLRRRYSSAAQVLSDLAPLQQSVVQQPVVGSPPARKRRSPTWQCVHTFFSPGKVQAIALSPTHPILASTSGTTIRLWDLHTGNLIRSLTGHLDLVSALAISPDGKRLISGSADKTIRLWELPSGNRLASLSLHTDTVLAIALSPRGILASSSIHDAIVLFDLTTGQEQHRLHGHANRVNALSFSPDGAVLASGSSDRTLRLWDTNTGQEVRTLQSQPIAALSFSPDGKTLVSGSWDGAIAFWSTQTRRLKKSLAVDSSRIGAVVYSPDGKLLATGGESLKLWQVRSTKELATLPPQTQISAIVFSADGQTLASSSWDGTIALWQREPIAKPKSRSLVD